MNISNLKTITIIGAGAMGTGITSVAATAFPQSKILLIDSNEVQLKNASDRLEKWNRKDRLKNPEIQFAEVEFLGDFKQLAKFSAPDLVIEAASENMQVKEKIFSQINEFATDETVLASNTSSLSLTKLALCVNKERRKNTLGLHFFNPARVMKLIEIIAAMDTSPETIEFARELCTAMGKTSVVCKDAPGFITSRLGIVLINEALFALQEGLASAEEIDTAIKLGYNHPMGPLSLADFIGLDVVFSVTHTMFENFQDSKYRPPVLLRKLVEAGHFGRKTGKGIFEYS